MKEPHWNPIEGYGDREGKRHQMISESDGKLVVDYNYDGKDRLRYNPNFMPLSAQLSDIFSTELEDECRAQTFRTGLLFFTMETPTMYALIYSKIGTPPELGTFFVLLGYQRLLEIAKIKFSQNEEKEHIGAAFAEMQIERENLIIALHDTVNKPEFNLEQCDEAMENAIVDILIPFTISYIALIERCCWRIYGYFTNHAMQARPRTIPIGTDQESAENQGTYCKILWEVMQAKWNDIYNDIPLQNTFALTPESFVSSRYRCGVNVAQAKFLFDFYRQESLIETVEVKV